MKLVYKVYLYFVISRLFVPCIGARVGAGDGGLVGRLQPVARAHTGDMIAALKWKCFQCK